MHEVHAVEALVDRLTSELVHHGIAEVRIRVGPTLSPEALEQAWEMLTQDTRLQGSCLVVEERPDQRTCPSCGGSWTVSKDDVAGHAVLCPSCGAASPIEDETGIEVLAIIGE